MSYDYIITYEEVQNYIKSKQPRNVFEEVNNIVNSDSVINMNFMADHNAIKKHIEKNKNDKQSFASVYGKLLIDKNMTDQKIIDQIPIEGSKYRDCVNGYRYIDKNLIFQIAVVLKCTINETNELLKSAGKMFDSSCKDAIVEYHLIQSNYDTISIDHYLELFRCDLLFTPKQKKTKKESAWLHFFLSHWGIIINTWIIQ